MADEPPETEPVTPPPAEPPDWARELKTAIVELPGKLKAVVTDDDKSQIAEQVHGLFERSGAFATPEPKADPPTGEVTEPTTDEPPPKKVGKLAKFASWFAGEEDAL